MKYEDPDPKDQDLNGTGTLLKGPAVPGVGSAARSGSGFWECAGQTGRPGSGGRLPAPSSSFLGKGKRVEYPDKDSALAPREYQGNGNMNDNQLKHKACKGGKEKKGPRRPNDRPLRPNFEKKKL